MTLSTAVLVNFPKPRFAVLPVTLGVELVSIGGTVSWIIYYTGVTNMAQDECTTS